MSETTRIAALNEQRHRLLQVLQSAVTWRTLLTGLLIDEDGRVVMIRYRKPQQQCGICQRVNHWVLVGATRTNWSSLGVGYKRPGRRFQARCPRCIRRIGRTR